MVDDVGGQRPALPSQLEMERAGSMGGQQSAVRCRDLEPLWLAAVVRLEGPAIEAKLLVDREVGEPGERLAFSGRDRAAVAALK